MENKKPNQTEKKTAGSCPSAMNCYLFFVFYIFLFFYKSERIRSMRAAIYNQHHVPDVYDQYCSLFLLFSLYLFYYLFLQQAQNHKIINVVCQRAVAQRVFFTFRFFF